jgi:TfoX/Sxy family transcriptional regulator of competence genes
MAYDEELADRVRNVLEARSEVSERKMFGGIAFMLAGNMAVGVTNDDLMVRLGAEDAEQAVVEEGVRRMDFTGKPLKGFVYVSPERIADDAGLAQWVDAGADFASSLPPKQQKK